MNFKIIGCGLARDLKKLDEDTFLKRSVFYCDV